jgi:hypothetical protein
MKNNILSFLFGLLLGIALTLLFQFLTVDDYSPPVKKVEIKSIEKHVAKSEVTYTKTIDSLKVKSAKLQVQLSDTKTELTKAKQRASSLQTTVYELLDKRLENDTKGNTGNDTSCDSLMITVDDLMQSSNLKDSLYEKVTSNLEEQVKNKDSTLVLKEAQYLDIKAAFSKSIDNQKELLDQNKLLDKQVKKQKFKSKVLSAALFILTGAAANYIIHH